MSRKTRLRLTPVEADYLGFTVREKEGRRNARYPVTPEQITILKEFRKIRSASFKEVKRTLDKNGNIVSTIEKLTSDNLISIPDNHKVKRISTNVGTSQQWVITEPLKQEDELKQDIEDLIKNLDKKIKKYIKPVDVVFKTPDVLISEFDRLVYTDVHIGMTTNENGHSLYGGVWNESEINRRLDVIIKHCLENQKSDKLFIDELGDFMDGWNGETVRKGHNLPQNMDNEKAFDIGLEFKCRLLDSLRPYFKNLVFNNICNDNHAGSFGYIVNSSFKSIAESKYNDVVVNNMRKFIDHYTVGNKAFILSHGKDGKNLKFGFKPVLDAKQIEKIKNYIDVHNLHNFDIEFSKGDSHQKLFDESSTDAFDYYNYGALSPSSEWVQTNFKRGSSFFEYFNFMPDGQKKHNPYKFKWEIGRVEESKNY